MAARPPLAIGTRLVLVDPEPAITPTVEGHQASNAYASGFRACASCEACTGIPAGDPHPWTEITVRAWDQFAGQDGELIVAPVTFSNVSGPRRIHLLDLLDLYEVVEDGEPETPWETPLEEVR